MKADRQAPIGVFDSGVGGLTVVREIMRNLPDERIVYFGDTARVPYGSKSKNTVIRYSRQIVHFLETQQVKAIVIACNTASALALDTIEKEIDLPIIGVVKPGAQMAVETTQNKRVGVIATESTIQSGLYQQLITEADPAITVYGKPCPLFVPLVKAVSAWLSHRAVRGMRWTMSSRPCRAYDTLCAPMAPMSWIKRNKRNSFISPLIKLVP